MTIDLGLSLRLMAADCLPREDREEALWLARARAGDEAAYRWLLGRYRARAVRLAAHVLRREGEAEDVAQEAFLQGLPPPAVVPGRGPLLGLAVSASSSACAWTGGGRPAGRAKSPKKPPPLAASARPQTPTRGCWWQRCSTAFPRRCAPPWSCARWRAWTTTRSPKRWASPSAPSGRASTRPAPSSGAVGRRHAEEDDHAVTLPTTPTDRPCATACAPCPCPTCPPTSTPASSPPCARPPLVAALVGACPAPAARRVLLAPRDAGSAALDADRPRPRALRAAAGLGHGRRPGPAPSLDAAAGPPRTLSPGRWPRPGLLPPPDPAGPPPRAAAATRRSGAAPA